MSLHLSKYHIVEISCHGSIIISVDWCFGDRPSIRSKAPVESYQTILHYSYTIVLPRGVGETLINIRTMEIDRE